MIPGGFHVVCVVLDICVDFDAFLSRLDFQRCSRESWWCKEKTKIEKEWRDLPVPSQNPTQRSGEGVVPHPGAALEHLALAVPSHLSPLL